MLLNHTTWKRQQQFWDKYLDPESFIMAFPQMDPYCAEHIAYKSGLYREFSNWCVRYNSPMDSVEFFGWMNSN